MGRIATFLVVGLCLGRGARCLGVEYKILHGPDKFARVTYPAPGHVELDEGTVEMWVRNDFDPQSRMTNRFYSPINYFYVRPGDLSLLARHSTGKRGGVLRGGKSLWARAGKATGGPHLHELGWREKGEWRFLAMTWQYRGGKCVRELYVDGERCHVESGLQERMALASDAEIHLGAYFFNGCFAALDQVRISAVRRTPEEIAAGFENGLKSDKFTLLFDDFEGVPAPGKGKKRRVETTPGKGAPGVVHGSFEIIDGRFGKALKLHIVEENAPRGEVAEK